MSIILDALKKSESDQQRQSGPALFEVRVAPPRPRLPVWAIAIVVLLAINMVVVGYLLLRRSSRSDETTTASTAAQTAATAPAATAPAAINPPQASYRPGQPPYQAYNGSGASYGQPPNTLPPGGGQPYNQPPNGAPPANGDAGGYGQPGYGQAPYGQSGYGQGNGQPPNYGPQGGGAGQFYNQPSNSGQSPPVGAERAYNQGANGGPGAGYDRGGNGQTPYNGSPSNGAASSNNMGPSPANTRMQTGRDTNEPTLGNNSRDNAANDAAGNPDDYAPATDPQSPLFKGHVKRGTDSGLVLYQDAAVVPGSNLPQLRLDLHVYGARPQDRFALINMHKMHEGESLPEGVRVESITPDGVIMSYNGSRFLLPRE